MRLSRNQFEVVIPHRIHSVHPGEPPACTTPVQSDSPYRPRLPEDPSVQPLQAPERGASAPTGREVPSPRQTPLRASGGVVSSASTLGDGGVAGCAEGVSSDALPAWRAKGSHLRAWISLFFPTLAHHWQDRSKTGDAPAVTV